MEVLRPALDELDALAELPPNWDLDGSGPPTAAARRRARNLILTAAQMYWNQARDLVQPFTVGAVPGSGVMLEWRCDRTKLVVFIHSDARSRFLFVDTRGGSRHSDQCDPTTGEQVLERLATVFGLTA